MSFEVELAKLLKSRNNINKIGATLGTVVNGGYEYKISIIDEMIYLDSSNSKVCDRLKDRLEEVVIDGYTRTIEYKNVLKAGDIVLVISTENNQFFYIVDKV